MIQDMVRFMVRRFMIIFIGMLATFLLLSLIDPAGISLERMFMYLWAYVLAWWFSFWQVIEYLSTRRGR